MYSAGTEIERFGFEQGVLYLAGPAAQKRALRGSGPGWVRSRSFEELNAHHEAGHCVVALSMDMFVHAVSIIPNPERRLGQSFSAGHCSMSRTEEVSHGPEPAMRLDHTEAVAHANLLAPFDDRPRWRSVLAIARAMRGHAEQIIERNWLLICAVANALVRERELDRRQIESLIRGSVVA